MRRLHPDLVDASASDRWIGSGFNLDAGGSTAELLHPNLDPNSFTNPPESSSALEFVADSYLFCVASTVYVIVHGSLLIGL